MADVTQLLENNRAWSRRMREQDPQFFPRLARQQAPQYLWIGCADSRVPANQIVGLLPGELFVHRNVANVVVHSDLNCLSVLHCAVDVLAVGAIIVCGHYGCGGVHAALHNQRLGLIDNWLRHIQDVRETHARRLATLAADPERCDRLCELNALEQVVHVCQTTVVQDAWEQGQELAVHGWIYSLHDGVLWDLGLRIARQRDLPASYDAALERRRG